MPALYDVYSMLQRDTGTLRAAEIPEVQCALRPGLVRRRPPTDSERPAPSAGRSVFAEPQKR